MEPMAIGSPANSPGGNQNQFLPPFLMGDPQNLTPHNNTLSPKPGRYNVSFATSPTSNTSQEYNRSGLGTRTLFGGPTGSGGATGANGNTSLTNSYGAVPSAAQHNSHQAGPPTQGLFETLRNEHSMVNSPQRSHLGAMHTPHSHLNTTPYNMGSNYSLNQSYQPPGSHLNDSYVPNAPNAVNASMRALYSPLGANMSPMSCTPMARTADFWVTIFGFSPGASSMILQHFTLCGTILDVVHAPRNGNWMHVRFSSRIESDKALNYNLKLIAGNVMIGVTRCSEKSIVDKENVNVHGQQNNELLKPKVLPFAQHSYKLAQHNNSVSPTKDVPQKSTGLVNKAMDLIFGW